LSYPLSERTGTILTLGKRSISGLRRKAAETGVKQELNSGGRNGIQVQIAGMLAVVPGCGHKLICT